ncbi:hypothetical protein SEEE5646_13337, partial [Salmonella enterica subsp. enterica serovar Enteritidis str. 50-5646]
IKAVRGAYLVTVYAWGVADCLTHAGCALLFKLLAGNNGYRLRRFNIWRRQLGRATLNGRGDNDGIIFCGFLGKKEEKSRRR